MTERSIAPGDIVARAGFVALVWSVGHDSIRVLPARRLHGTRFRGDVEIGSAPLSPIKGPMLVTVSKSEAWLPGGCDRIGAVERPVLAAVQLAARREAEARQIEASVASSAVFAACKPSFRSGGRRVGGGARE